MDRNQNPQDQKFFSFINHAPIGIAEIDQSGKIIWINIAGKALLGPLSQSYQLGTDNAFVVLDCIDPQISEAIKAFDQPSGSIVQHQIENFILPDETLERHYQLSANKIHENCIILSCEDLTQKLDEEKAMNQAVLEQAVSNGKFEIASEVLHDIGNAVVGFGSYLTRINRFLEQDSMENLENVVSFLKTQQVAIGTAIGGQKSAALVNLLEGIVKKENDSRTEIKKSIQGQLSVITHIQEILTIQRQYVTGQNVHDRRPVNLKEILFDSRAMLFASYDKKGIKLNLNVPDHVQEIKGDRTKLMQVVLNILKNSIEAIDMNANDKMITINLLLHDQSLELSVIDNGHGFDERVASHLFERGHTTKTTGTGLGLYNCRSIVESHGGSIEMYSKGPGMGTTTIIKFIL